MTNDDIFECIMPYFYDNLINPIGLRIASGFILREIYKNKKIYVNYFLQDQNAI